MGPGCKGLGPPVGGNLCRNAVLNWGKLLWWFMDGWCNLFWELKPLSKDFKSTKWPPPLGIRLMWADEECLNDGETTVPCKGLLKPTPWLFEFNEGECISLR